MKVAFPYIAQTHHVPHSLPLAAELAMRRPDWQVHVVCSSDEQERVVRRVLALYPEARLQIDRFRIGPLLRLHQRLLGAGIPGKVLTLFANRGYFRGFDAAVVPERTSLLLRRLRLPGLKLVWTNHGAPGRAVTYAPDLVEFDYLLLTGERQAARMRELGLLREGRYHTGTYAKFDLVTRLAARRERLFANDRPTALYNPHFEGGLSSWPRDGFQVLEHFAQSKDWNLIFAPHIRLFDTHDGDTLARLAKFRSLPHMLIDTGSDASIDMSYTQTADAYIGDVSSQIAEFMVRPRPCVFINSHRVAWQDDPDYQAWKLGPVIEDAGLIATALSNAVTSHPQWVARQQAYFRATFDADPDAIGHSAGAGAMAIANFLEQAPELARSRDALAAATISPSAIRLD